MKDIENILDGRIILICVILHGIKLSVICAYAPTEEYAESTKQTFFSKLRNTITTVKQKHPTYKIIIGADMNATIGCDSNGSWPYLGANNDNLPTNDNGSRLLRLSHECKLFIMNSVYHSKQHHRHTWYSPTGFTKRVDYILTEWHIKKLSSTVVFIVVPAFHLSLIIDFWPSHVLSHQNVNKILFFRKPTSTKKSYTNIKSLKDNKNVLNNFTLTLDGFLQSEPNFNDMDSFEKYFTECIIKASKTTIPNISSSSKNCPWVIMIFYPFTTASRIKRSTSLKELNRSIRK